MKYFSCMVILIVNLFLILLAFVLINKISLRKKSNMNKYSFTVCISFGLCLTSIITTSIFSVLLLLLNIFYEINLTANIICISFICIFAFICFVLIKEKTMISGNKITHIPAFGKIKEYDFSDIKKVKLNSYSRGASSYSVFSDKKMFTLSGYSINIPLFLTRISELKIELN